MDCREFRKKHVAFVDDVLPAIEMHAMQRHRASCSRCSRQDTAIRRSLLVVRNIAPIEPSADFMARLNARLEQLGPEERGAHIDRVAPRPYMTALGVFGAFAAGLAAVAYMAVETTHYFSPTDGVHAAPVVASVPAFDPSPASLPSAAFVASVPTGMPVWPALLMVGQGPMHFASMDFHDVDLER